MHFARPKLFDCLEGYTPALLTSDLGAGVTVGIVALPLAIGFGKFHRRGTHLVLSGVQPQPMKILLRSGLVDRIGLDNICPNIDEALIRARAILGAG